MAGGLLDAANRYGVDALGNMRQAAQLENDRVNFNRKVEAQESAARTEGALKGVGYAHSIYNLVNPPAMDFTAVKLSDIGGGAAAEAFHGAGLAGEIGSAGSGGALSGGAGGALSGTGTAGAASTAAGGAAGSAAGGAAAGTGTAAAGTGAASSISASGLGSSIAGGLYGIGNAAGAAWSALLALI